MKNPSLTILELVDGADEMLQNGPGARLTGPMMGACDKRHLSNEGTLFAQLKMVK